MASICRARPAFVVAPGAGPPSCPSLGKGCNFFAAGVIRPRPEAADPLAPRCIQRAPLRTGGDAARCGLVLAFSLFVPRRRGVAAGARHFGRSCDRLAAGATVRAGCRERLDADLRERGVANPRPGFPFRSSYPTANGLSLSACSVYVEDQSRRARAAAGWRASFQGPPPGVTKRMLQVKYNEMLTIGCNENAGFAGLSAIFTPPRENSYDKVQRDTGRYQR